MLALTAPTGAVFAPLCQDSCMIHPRRDPPGAERSKMVQSDQQAKTSVEALADILSRAGELVELRGATARPVGGCSFDSRSVAVGDVFFCKGAAFRPAFLEMALDAQAAAFVCEESLVDELAPLGEKAGAAMLVVRHIRTAMALLPPVVYGHPDRDVDIVGITGTKGKTTASFMMQSIIKAAGQTCGMIGSVLTDDGIESYESTNTTPEAPEVWRHIANCRAAGRPSLVMEISSQALKYQRVENLELDVACFLNIGRDHISPVEHPTFEDYFASKLKIFDQARTAVVNLGTDEADRVLAAAGAARKLVTVGVEHPEADLWASDVRMSGFNIEFDLHGFAEDEPEDGEHILLGIAGDFNVENALVAIAAAREIGIGIDAVKIGLAKFRVPGRMEVVESKDGRVIAVVDYAHNQLSFRSLFSSVKRAFPQSPVIALFGAAGGKAQERREQLPRAAAPYSDLLIFTNEDPGREDPEKICRELAANVPDDTPYRVIVDRAEAVHAAFEAARREYTRAGVPTIVLLLAKGDEELMHVGDAFVPIESDLSLAHRMVDTVGVA